MHTKETIIINKTGLHARPAAEFVGEAKKYTSKITIQESGKEKKGNAKSIVTILSLGLSKGKSIEICADGPDEKEAVDSLIALIQSGFNEEK